MKLCALKLICDANNIKIDSSLKYNVIFGASGAYSLVCVLIASEKKETLPREGRGGISPSTEFKGVAIF